VLYRAQQEEYWPFLKYVMVGEALHVNLVIESIIQAIPLHFESVYGYWRVFLSAKLFH
jgi:hypothetical protein